MVSDYACIIKDRQDTSQEEKPYLFVVTPADLGSEDQDSWEGKLTMLKKSFERSTDRLHETLEKRFDQLKSQVNDSVNSDEASSKAVSDLVSHVLTSVNKLGDRMAKSESNFMTFNSK